MHNFTINDILEKTYSINNLDFIQFLFQYRLLKSSIFCIGCDNYMKFVLFKRHVNGFTWRCFTRTCVEYKKYKTIRLGSFFDGFNIKLKFIFKVVILRFNRDSLTKIVEFFGNKSVNSICKIINKLHDLIPNSDFSDDKFGVTGLIVQIDETMLNYKC
ncbi:hypothetical protein DMUE_3818 [Dictyocoela muelleri]|nr:hypothetical protein DMUE_3818 [Dictyocoela muelleri]